MDVLASAGFICLGCLFRHYCVSDKTISPNSRIEVLASVGFVCFGCLFYVSLQCGCSLRCSFVYVLMFWTSKNTHLTILNHLAKQQNGCTCIGRIRLFALFVEALLCFSAVWLFTLLFFCVHTDALDI